MRDQNLSMDGCRFVFRYRVEAASVGPSLCSTPHGMKVPALPVPSPGCTLMCPQEREVLRYTGQQLNSPT